ncbi:hypothetical protein Csa_023664, partial [Cucumis sativus]
RMVPLRYTRTGFTQLLTCWTNEYLHHVIRLNCGGCKRKIHGFKNLVLMKNFLALLKFLKMESCCLRSKMTYFVWIRVEKRSRSKH